MHIIAITTTIILTITIVDDDRFFIILILSLFSVNFLVDIINGRTTIKVTVRVKLFDDF